MTHPKPEDHDPENCAGCTAEMNNVISGSRFVFANHCPERLFVMPDLGAGSVEFGTLDGVLYKRRMGSWVEVDIKEEIEVGEKFLESVMASASKENASGAMLEEEVNRYVNSLVSLRVQQLRDLNYKSPRDAFQQEIVITKS